MSVSDILTELPSENPYNVYFYPGLVKVDRSGLNCLTDHLRQIFDEDVSLPSKLYKTEFFCKSILKNLYKFEALKDDDTMVIFDRVVDEHVFNRAVGMAYSALSSKKNGCKRNGLINALRRAVTNPIFLKKDRRILDFIALTLSSKIYKSSLLGPVVNLKEHKNLSFKPLQELDSYILALITKKGLLDQGTSIYNIVLFLPVIIDLIEWHAKSIAYIKNTDSVTSEVLSEALETFDRHYIGDPVFINMLKKTFVGKCVKALSY